MNRISRSRDLKGKGTSECVVRGGFPGKDSELKSVAHALGSDSIYTLEGPMIE